MKFISFTLILSTVVFSFGCASYFKRKECNKTNWHEYGHKVAMSGKRIDADNFINECKKVEADINHAALDRGFKSGMANYCKPKTVYNTGKKGQYFTEDMCDGSKLRILRKRHAEGVRAFCKPNSAFRFGGSGEKYNGICPENLEEAFMASYNKGRVRFLRSEIRQNEKEIRSMDHQIRRKVDNKTNLTYQLAALAVVRGDAANDENNPIVRRRRKLRSSIDQEESAISSLRSKQEGLRNQNREYRRELTSLGG